MYTRYLHIQVACYILNQIAIRLENSFCMQLLSWSVEQGVHVIYNHGAHTALHHWYIAASLVSLITGAASSEVSYMLRIPECQQILLSTYLSGMRGIHNFSDTW